MSRVAVRPRAGMERPRALTTPAVTLPSRPSGLPTATTSEPTRSRSASPNVRGLRDIGSGADDGQVGEGIASDDGERTGHAVSEGHLAAARVADDVSVGDQMALGAEHDPRAGAAPRAHRGHARCQVRGHAGHHGGIGVQGLVIGHYRETSARHGTDSPDRFRRTAKAVCRWAHVLVECAVRASGLLPSSVQFARHLTGINDGTANGQGQGAHARAANFASFDGP